MDVHMIVLGEFRVSYDRHLKTFAVATIPVTLAL